MTDLRTVEPVDTVRSAGWSRAIASSSIIVATHQRAEFLPELFASLARLRRPSGGLELVIADDGSSDSTWEVLGELVASTPLPALAIRLPASGGPSVPRNSAALHSRGQVLLITDDDCLPEPDWAGALTDAWKTGVGIVQGQTMPTTEGRAGDWDRSIMVRAFSGLYETCNLAVDRSAFIEAGGFPLIQAFGDAPRGFGEDTLLGVAVDRAAGSRWAADAVVRHRWLPGTFRDHLAGRRRLEGFPLLIKLAPELRRLMWCRVFLTRRTAALDAAIAGVALAAGTDRPSGLVLAVPWLCFAAREARQRTGRRLPRRFAQVAVADLTAAASLVAGTVKHRRVLL